MMSIRMPEIDAASFEGEGPQGAERHRRLFLLLILMLALLISVGVMFIRYLMGPAPLPSMLPLPVDGSYAPHYLFSIYGVEKPVGVAVSRRGDRVYVAESGGERLVKAFDRDGDLLGAFAPPRTEPGERSPVYLATDWRGHVFVSDRLQHAVFVYDGDGAYLDTILSPDLTLSEYVVQCTDADGLPASTTFAYDMFESRVHYHEPGKAERICPPPGPASWSPLGIRMIGTDQMLLTDVSVEHHTVRQLENGVLGDGSEQESDLHEIVFGTYGQGTGQFLFPNSAVADSQERIYVTDSNNGRVSVWDTRGHFLFDFGQGADRDSLSLPRGAAIDGRDCLYVVDAVGQDVKVYDVSGVRPDFLFAFGSWGAGNGQFNYPNDITIDVTGRLYITDRENDRVQVWLY